MRLVFYSFNSNHFFFKKYASTSQFKKAKSANPNFDQIIIFEVSGELYVERDSVNKMRKTNPLGHEQIKAAGSQ